MSEFHQELVSIDKAESEFDKKIDAKILKDKIEAMAESIFIKRVKMFRNCSKEAMAECIKEAKDDSIFLANYYFGNNANKTEK